jgi:hypothetical protein
MVAVGKNEKQEIMIAHVIEEGQVDDLVEWTTYSDWESRPLPF